MYRPLPSTPLASKSTVTSTMAKEGVNKRDLPQLLTPNQALIIENYLITGDGGLEKRGGLTKIFDASDLNGITAIKEWDSDTLVFGYANGKLAAGTISTGTITDIKTFTSDVTSLARYSNGYMFVASPSAKINRITRTLGYDAQTANFTAGLTMTGAISGATGLILQDADGGSTGTLTLGDIVGTFQDDELITDSGTGSADADGVVTFTATEIAAAPICKIITVVDARLFAGNLSTDSTAVKYSDVDQGANPPFNTWSNGSLETEGGIIFYRNAGAVNVIDNLGAVVIIGSDQGKWAFTIDTIDSAGTISKIENRVMQREDAGMKAAIQTKEGLFYVNSQGIWKLVSVGQSNIAFSDQEFKISDQLGDDFFDKADLSQVDFLKDDKTNQLLLTFRSDADQNNAIVVYNTELKGFASISGWNINRFVNVDGSLYGAGSGTAKIWRLFDGNDDDGTDIWYEFEQELSVGQLWTRKSLNGQYIQGKLSPSSTPLIQFSIFDRDGVLISNKLKLQWNYGVSDLAAKGYGESSWGDPFGGDIDTAGPIDQFAGSKSRIKNFQRIRVNISGHDKAPHTVNWLSLDTTEKIQIRQRNLTKI